MTSLSTRKCIECDEPFKGRTDKKFCSDACRTAYNNKLNSENNTLVRKVNRKLQKNRRILCELNPSGKVKVAIDTLSELGFDFKYFTSIYTSKDGAQYFYCYDQGYTRMKNNLCLLVQKKDS